jgi:hypothetical protein
MVVSFILVQIYDFGIVFVIIHSLTLQQSNNVSVLFGENLILQNPALNKLWWIFSYGFQHHVLFV